MGTSFAQTLGSAAQQYEDARAKKIAEAQTQQELNLKQDQLAKTLQMEMLRMKIEEARAKSEEGRYAAEQERLKNSGWSKVGQDYQQPDGTWKSIWYNPVTGETREKTFGTPRAVAIQDLKGDQATDLQKLKDKDKLDQIAASGRWHMRWSALSQQGKLKKEDWNYLRTDPGYIEAISGMKNSMAQRNMILARMYSPTNPPSADQMKELNQQLQDVEGRIKQSADTAEKTRNRIVYKTEIGMVGDLAKNVQSQVDQKGDGTPRPPNVPAGYVHRKRGSHGPGWYAPGTN